MENPQEDTKSLDYSNPLAKIQEKRKLLKDRQKQPLICPYCKASSKEGMIIRKGERKKKMQTVQVYKCKNKEGGCGKIFTTQISPTTTYPMKTILRAITEYNLGRTQEETIKEMLRRYKIKIPQRTLSEWINKYKNILPYNRLREEIKNKKLYTPETIIKKKKLYHSQVYEYQVHRGKLDYYCPDIKKHPELFTGIIKNDEKGRMIQELSNAGKYSKLREYLKKVLSKEYPHWIFGEPTEQKKKYYREPFSKRKAEGEKIGKGYEIGREKITAEKNVEQQKETRGSQIRIPLLQFRKTEKKNYANILTKLALELAKDNKERHEKVQELMLINDSTTIAVEIPVYLTKNDLWYFNKRGFMIEPLRYKTPLTGHIDVLQIRNGMIHIMDYKPQTKKVDAREQLLLYALALASRTKLPLREFKCSWFDEEDYYEFYPLHAIRKKG